MCAVQHTLLRVVCCVQMVFAVMFGLISVCRECLVMVNMLMFIINLFI